ncbi:MAG: cytochrome c biogenesis CcdA family protein [Clostridiales bacterium]|nr:cytochrome c biogenesis CcdA family protein [Clostridiales bacterium]
MDYLLSFLEGMITFLSPCLLPMIPVYVAFFTGQHNKTVKNRALLNAFGFILGFTLLFVFLGAFAGTLGHFLKAYSSYVSLFTGLFVILFGLHFMGAIRLPYLNINKQLSLSASHTGFFSCLLFGMIFAVSWTPCAGVFLGSALMLAANSGESTKGITMLLCYSFGLGIPFLISAVLIERVKSTFAFIKKHYKIFNIISGLFLIVVGLFMATGYMNTFLSLLTF